VLVSLLGRAVVEEHDELLKLLPSLVALVEFVTGVSGKRFQPAAVYGRP
jgi:hypothetical protein